MKVYPALLIGLLFCTGCTEKKEHTTAQIASITESIYASGNTVSYNQYKVFATVTGTLRKADVSAGDQLEIGDTLFVIDNLTSELAEENARLAYELAARQAQDRSDVIKELELRIDQNKTQMLNDSVMFYRQERLWKKDIGSKADYDQKKLAFETSKNNYLTSLTTLDKTRDQLTVSKQQAENALRISRKQANDFVVRSLLDGQVFDVYKEEGERVDQQNPLALIGSADSFIIDLQVDEYDINDVEMGQEVIVTLDSYRDRTFKAQVSKITPIMDEASRTFLVEATFTEAPAKLYPNLTVEASIVRETRHNTLVIPRKYLLPDSTVLLKKNQKQPVKTGLANYQFVEILSGLDTNTTIYLP